MLLAGLPPAVVGDGTITAQKDGSGGTKDLTTPNTSTQPRRHHRRIPTLEYSDDEIEDAAFLKDLDELIRATSDRWRTTMHETVSTTTTAVTLPHLVVVTSSAASATASLGGATMIAP
jgi:hypothetical protein